MQLPNKLTKCNWDGDHDFRSSAAGTGLVRHVCEVCRQVSFDSVDYLSTKPMTLPQCQHDRPHGALGHGCRVTNLPLQLHIWGAPHCPPRLSIAEAGFLVCRAPTDADPALASAGARVLTGPPGTDVADLWFITPAG